MYAALTNIQIDFEQSHLFFPRIIITILAILLVVIAIMHLPHKIQQFKNGDKMRFFEENYDKFKLFSTIALIMIYFKAMEVVGGFFPNMGYGFLFTSIVFIFVISLLFIGKSTKKKLIAITLNSIITPALAWFIFGYLFHITLP